MAITPQNILRVSVGLILTATILFLVWYFSSVVIYILVSAVLAIIGRPLVNWLVKRRIGRHYMPRWAAASLTIVVMMAIFMAVISLFIPLIFNKINEFTHLDIPTVLASIEQPISHAQAYLQRMFALPETHFSLSDTIVETVRQFINYNTLNNTFTSIVGTALSAVIAIFSIAFITFFFLKEDGLFYAMVKGLFPERLQQNVTRALDSITLLLSRYFTGILTESLILMIIISIAMILFGMKTDNALLIGLVMGVLNVIPYAGRGPHRWNDRHTHRNAYLRHAVLHQGFRRLCTAAHHLLRACEGTSAGGIFGYSARRIYGWRSGNAARHTIVHRAASTGQGVLLGVLAGAEVNTEHITI